MNKHKVFISYHHGNDQIYKRQLVELNRQFNLFVDYSVRDGEINDELSSEAIRVKIRDDFIKEATVLILLCGTETKKRKHVDWELNAAMYQTEKNPKLGMLVINLPTIAHNSSRRAHNQEEREIINPHGFWTTFNSREEYERNYPYMPARVLDSFEKGAKISVVDWQTIVQSPDNLRKLIDEAFKRRKTMEYDHSRNLRRNNS